MKKYLLILLIVGKDFICISQIPTQQEYKELASLFAIDVQLMGNIKDYNPVLNQPFSYSTVLELEGGRTAVFNRKILIIVNSSIYDQLQWKINRYAFDINYMYGYKIVMIKVSGASHQQIKSIILSESTNLDGVVLIGDLPAAWYEVENDFEGYAPEPNYQGYGYANWPCDLYYMDIDGVWNDTDGNGIYDSHTGNVHPEFFLGRISTSHMGTLLTEKIGLEQYLDKDHRFYLGHYPVNKQYGLAYTDSSWVNSSQFQSIKYLYGNNNYDRIDFGNPFFGKTDYLSRLSNNRYEFIQVACHSDYHYHILSTDVVLASDIFNNGTKAIGYNLYSCCACRWTSIKPTSQSCFLAGAYIYNSTNSGLVAVGSTKSGSMLNFSGFYTPLGNGKSMGDSFFTWWKATCSSTYSNYNVYWYYGMTIIGDPMVNFYHCMNNFCVNQITLNSFDISNTVSHRYIISKNSITANNYVIPTGKSIIFNASEVSLNAGFECPVGSTFEISNEGCMSNCQ